MNLFQHYMGQYGQPMQMGRFGPSMDNGEQPQMMPRPWLQPGWQQQPTFNSQPPKGLLGIYGQQGPDHQIAPLQPTPLPPMQQNVGTGGGLPPQQQLGNQGNGLAGMFRGFSPYGRQYMR